MQKTDVPSDLSSFDIQHSVFKRVANLLLLLVAVAMGVNVWLVNTHHADNWHQQQSSQLGDSLLTVSSKIIGQSMAQDDQQGLQNQIQAILQDPNVLSVSLYNQHGEKLNIDQGRTSLLSLFHTRETPPLVFVQPIEEQGELIGYLQLLLDKERVMTYHQDYQTYLNNQIWLLMGFAAGLGFLLARVFYKFRYKKLLRITKP
jgi:membrane protein